MRTEGDYFACACFQILVLHTFTKGSAESKPPVVPLTTQRVANRRFASLREPEGLQIYDLRPRRGKPNF